MINQKLSYVCQSNAMLTLLDPQSAINLIHAGLVMYENQNDLFRVQCVKEITRNLTDTYLFS